MESSRLKEILDVCNLDELDSIDILFSHVKKYDLELQKRILKKVQKEKYDIYSSSYEGMNEYDDITIINNFNISNTFDYVILNPYELICLKKIMEDAIINIKNSKNPLDMKIVPNIEKALEKFNIRLNELNDLSYIITDEELEILLNKFDVIEIEELYTIFKYIDNYNIEKMMDISNKVHHEKAGEAAKNYEVFVRPYDYDISKLCTKRNKLNDTELQLLCSLLEDAIFGVMAYKEEHDKDECEKCEKLESSLYNLLASYSDELDKKNSKTYKKTLK